MLHYNQSITCYLQQAAYTRLVHNRPGCFDKGPTSFEDSASKVCDTLRDDTLARVCLCRQTVLRIRSSLIPHGWTIPGQHPRTYSTSAA